MTITLTITTIATAAIQPQQPRTPTHLCRALGARLPESDVQSVPHVKIVTFGG